MGRIISWGFPFHSVKFNSALKGKFIKIYLFSYKERVFQEYLNHHIARGRIVLLVWLGFFSFALFFFFKQIKNSNVIGPLKKNGRGPFDPRSH